MGIKFCSSVMLVKDINVSRNFYEGLLGQEIEFDHAVVTRYIKSGMKPDEVATRTSMPIDFVIKQAEDLKNEGYSA